MSQEKKSVLDFEQLSNELTAERQRLETALEVSRATADRKLQELKDDNDELNRTVATLHERAKISGDRKVKTIEKENKVGLMI